MGQRAKTQGELAALALGPHIHLLGSFVFAPSAAYELLPGQEITIILVALSPQGPA